LLKLPNTNGGVGGYRGGGGKSPSESNDNSRDNHRGTKFHRTKPRSRSWKVLDCGPIAIIQVKNISHSIEKEGSKTVSGKWGVAMNAKKKDGETSCPHWGHQKPKKLRGDLEKSRQLKTKRRQE